MQITYFFHRLHPMLLLQTNSSVPLHKKKHTHVLTMLLRCTSSKQHTSDDAPHHLAPHQSTEYASIMTGHITFDTIYGKTYPLSPTL